MKQTLIDSEERYRRLFEAAQDGILILNAETGEIEDVNPYLIQMLGYSHEEFVKKKLWDVGAFKDIPASKDAFATLQENEIIRYDNLPLKTKDGRLIQVEFVSNVYLVGGQKVVQCNIRNITERLQAQQSAYESQERYRTVLNNMMEGCQIIDYDWRYIYLNNAAAKHSRKLPVELLMHTMMDVYPGIESTALFQKLQVSMEKRIRQRMENQFFYADGSFAWFELSIQPVPEGIFVLSIDITQRKQADEMQAKLVAIVESSDDAIFGIRDGVITSWNRGAERIYGYTAKEAIGQLIFIMVPPELSLEASDIINRVASGESVQNFETVHLRKDGKRFDVSLTVSPIRDATSGQLHGISTIARDVTERKRSEELIRESDNRFRALLQNSADAITLLDATGVVIYDSPAAPGILGYSPEDWIGQDVFKLVHPDDLPEVRALFMSVTQKADARLNSMFRVRHKSRSWLWLEVVATNLLHQPGVNAIVLNYRDITKRKQADEKLRSAREFLQSVQDALSAHIAILDHKGVIVQVNAAWRDFDEQNGLISADYGIGMNYLEICEKAEGDFSEQGQLMAKAIRNVLKSPEIEVSIEYPCDAPNERRWFVARVTSFENNHSKWLVVAHTNITERKLVEIEVQHRLSELEVLYESGLAFSHLLNPQMIAQKMSDLFDQKLNWHHTAIRLYHVESQTLELLAFNLPHSISSKERNAAKKRFMQMTKPDQGLTGWVIQHGDMLRCDDLQNDERYFETFPGLQSGLYVPIKAGEQVLGVISIESEQAHAFHPSDERLLVTLAAQVAIALENAHLFEQLKRSHLELVSAYDATIEGWSRALDLRDKETEGHSLRVTAMALKLAQALGLSDDELIQIRWGALLHDIGKMGVPDGILLKPGKLTDDEWAIMKEHPRFAYEMLLPIEYLHGALDIPYYHHEKWDGTGYPNGLKDRQIPLAARIFSVVDVWDALRSDRPYRAGWENQKVLDYISAASGTNFDPRIVDAFLQILH